MRSPYSILPSLCRPLYIYTLIHVLYMRACVRVVLCTYFKKGCIYERGLTHVVARITAGPPPMHIKTHASLLQWPVFTRIAPAFVSGCFVRNTNRKSFHTLFAINHAYLSIEKYPKKPNHEFWKVGLCSLSVSIELFPIFISKGFSSDCS